jgi:hypothetical protein
MVETSVVIHLEKFEVCFSAELGISIAVHEAGQARSRSTGGRDAQIDFPAAWAVLGLLAMTAPFDVTGTGTTN